MKELRDSIAFSLSCGLDSSPLSLPASTTAFIMLPCLCLPPWFQYYAVNFHFLLQPAEVFQSVVRCSLALANCSTSHESNVSKKAKAWVQTQLRRATTPNLKKSNLLEIGEYWGYTGQECTEMMVDKVSLSLSSSTSIKKKRSVTFALHLHSRRQKDRNWEEGKRMPGIKTSTRNSTCQFLIGKCIDSWHNLITRKLVDVIK